MGNQLCPYFVLLLVLAHVQTNEAVAFVGIQIRRDLKSFLSLLKPQKFGPKRKKKQNKR